MMFYTIKLKSIITAAAAFIIICSAAFAAAVFAQFSDNNDTEGIKVPIIMYHSILKDESRSGKYIITPYELESDLKYLSRNGYTAILMSDLIAYVYHNEPLPEKPVILTFDDGHYNNFTYAYPLMQKYGMKFVISIVGEYTDNYTQNPDPNPNYAYLSWDDARVISESGIAEIQNHTYSLHSIDKNKTGCKRIRGEDVEAYRSRIGNDIQKLQDDIKRYVGKEAQTFTYPFGGISPESEDVIKQIGFKASLSCSEGINTVTHDPECLYLMKRCLRSNKRSAAQILSDQGM